MMDVILIFVWGRGNSSGGAESSAAMQIVKPFCELTECKAPEGPMQDSSLTYNQIFCISRDTSVKLTLD